MKKFMRWAGLAAFCAVFGFAGAVGGLQLMADDLRGEQGERGPSGVQGVIGPPGEVGEPGPAGPEADVAALESDIAQLRMSVSRLTPRVDDLEAEGDAPPPPTTTACTPGTPTNVVTDAELTKVGRNLSLSTTKKLITPCS